MILVPFACLVVTVVAVLTVGVVNGVVMIKFFWIGRCLSLEDGMVSSVVTVNRDAVVCVVVTAV